jgi:ABC-2 type transport system permease protein
MKNNKTASPVKVIFNREMAAYFSSPIAYIVTSAFLILTGIFFFSTFFLNNRADLRGFFGLLPVFFAFLIPAITMRSFSEETRSGSFETLMTLPVTGMDVVLGKFLSTWCQSCCLLVPSLMYVITASIFGNPDFGPIIGGYIGAVFLAAAFTAIGIFSSSITKNQIIALFVGIIICLFLGWILDVFMVLLPAGLVSVFQFFSAGQHFSSISRGILDSRDLLYFISLTVLFFSMTVNSVTSRRAA